MIDFDFFFNNSTNQINKNNINPIQDSYGYVYIYS